MFKSLKPHAIFAISVRLTDTISAIKTQLSAEPSAPPADAQRLLFKGKALADGKLLKEYNNIKDGDTINLMVKPGYDWNTTTAISGVGEKDIIDPGVLPSPVLQPDAMSTYQHTMSQPEFWERLHVFLKYVFCRLGCDQNVFTRFSFFTEMNFELQKMYIRRLKSFCVPLKDHFRLVKLPRFVIKSALLGWLVLESLSSLHFDNGIARELARVPLSHVDCHHQECNQHY